MLVDWSQCRRKPSVNWLTSLSISSAPQQSSMLIGQLPKVCDALDVRDTLVTCTGYADADGVKFKEAGGAVLLNDKIQRVALLSLSYLC